MGLPGVNYFEGTMQITIHCELMVKGKKYKMKGKIWNMSGKKIMP